MTAHPVPSRRVVLNGAGLAAITLCLGGCAAAPGAASSAASGGPTTVKAADVPVGSGTIVGQFVVTQPKAGTYEAFSYLCTHQNLPVQQVTDAAIVCGRHGSTYSLADGTVLTGPATKALTKATVTVNGDTLTIS
ncbi:MAG TPA: Rieske (2Fe-2S) protein [Propionicimonas sp.]|jgi:nitrite reductase/ring-hydroxylating ferredoxin subunit|uniref:Rieske (2Fe-2S) protein n=1 Tax=Propionicimonas sp. TaxID=1955623 RepID=UPI002F3F8B8C